MPDFKVGLNIYTLYYQFVSNMENAFESAAKAGYSTVEMFGALDTPPQEVLSRLSRQHLSMCSFHIGKELLYDDSFNQTVQYNKALRNDTMVIPCYQFTDNLMVKDWEQFAAFLQKTSEKVRKLGMKLGYHNHAIEFKKIDGIRPWDIVMSNTSDEVLMQLDLGNTRSSEQVTDKELAEVLKKYRSRSPIVHIKPWSKEKGFDCILGQDDINWPMLVDICKEYGSTETFLVEMEVHNTTLERIRPCYDYLAGLVLKN